MAMSGKEAMAKLAKKEPIEASPGPPGYPYPLVENERLPGVIIDSGLGLFLETSPERGSKNRKTVSEHDPVKE